MKKTLITLVLLALSLLGIAQDLDSLNQNKYWVYRDRFKKHFTHIGGIRPGESLPMDVIRRNLNCGDFSGDRIESGDVMAAMGEYLGVLATEYYLLNQTDNYEALEACKHELYYAISAINKVDEFAEIFFDPLLNSPDTKGFFVRDNIPEDYYQYWEETDNIRFHGAHATSGFVPDSILVTSNNSINYQNGSPWLWANDRFAMKATDNPSYQGTPWFGLHAYKHDQCPTVRTLAETMADENLRVSNEMSQDHALGILLGIKFIKSYINDETLFIQPTANDSGMWVMAETRLIADRIMTHLAKNKITNQEFTFPIRVKDDDGNSTTKGLIEINFNEANYIIMNPVTGLPVDRGWEAFAMSHGYRKLGQDLTGLYYPPATIDVKSIHKKNNSGGGNGVLNWLINRLIDINDISKLDSLKLKAIWDTIPYLAANTSIVNDVNMQMVLRLGAATGLWTHQQFLTMAETQNFPWFELMYANLNSKTPLLSKQFYDSLLNQAACEGVSKWDLIEQYDTQFDLNGQITSIDTSLFQPHAPFNKSSIFSLPNRNYNSQAWIDGDFNGLDYMLLHNLFRISFANDIEKPAIAQGCPCKSTVNEGLTVVSGDTLKSIARFPEYRKINIRVPEFITHDMRIVSDGVLFPKGDLTICKGLVRLATRGKIQINTIDKSRPKELRINSGGVLELRPNSTLQLDTFSKVIIEPGGVLRIFAGSSIILDKGAVLEINGTLELMHSATLSPSSGSFGLGYVKMSNNGANSSFARAEIIGRPYSTINLFSAYQGFKILEINGTEAVTFPKEVEVSLTSGKTTLGDGSALIVEGKLTVADMDFDAENANQPYGYGLVTVGQKDIEIIRSTFKNGKVGIACHNYLNGNTPKIDQIEMENMDVGVYSQGLGFEIQGEFDNCNEGVYLVKPSIPGEIHNSRIENGGNGIVYDAQSTGSMRIRYGTIKDNQAFGVYGMNGSILLECSQFNSNGDAIYLQHNPFVSVNENQKAGGNIFQNNTTSVINCDAGAFQLDLVNGHSAFKNNTQLFDGYLMNHSGLLTPAPPTNKYRLASSYNYWDIFVPYQYDLKYIVGTAGKINAASVSLEHQNHFTSESTLYTKQTSLCPSYSSGAGSFAMTGAGAMLIDTDNQDITNPYYVNATLGDVFENINDVMYYQNNCLEAYYRAKSVFDYNLATLSHFDEYVLSRVYRTMMEGYGELFYDDNILVDKNGITTELLGTLEDLQTLGLNPADSFWRTMNVPICMDIAEVHRMNNRRDTAIMVLSDKRASVFDNEILQNIDNFICVISAEKDLMDGIIQITDMQGYECYNPEYQNAAPFAPINKDKIKEEAPQIDWAPQPNPAKTDVDIYFNLKTRRFVEIEVYNILGHKIASKPRAQFKTGVNTITFDVEDWPTGVYFVKFNYDSFSDSKRLLIKHD